MSSILLSRRGEIAAAGGVLTYAQQVLADNPLGFWKLDETSGTAAADSSGHGINGTTYNSPTRNVSPLINDTGKAITVTSGSGVDCTNNASFQIGVGTIEAWVKATTGPAYGAICGKENNYCMFMRQGLNLIAYSWGSPSGDKSSGVAINDGNPHQVCFVFDTGVTNGSQLYVDGAAAGAAFTWARNNDGTAFRIGTNGGTSNPFTGTIDNVSVYGTKLSSARIAAHYAARL